MQRDGRVRRGEERRAAWQAAAAAIRRSGARELRGALEEPSELAQTTLEAIATYCEARARGRMGSPPGGVGGGE